MSTAKEKKEVHAKLRARPAATKRKIDADEEEDESLAEQQPKAKRTKREIIAEQRAFALNPPKGKPVLYNPAVKSGTIASMPAFHPGKDSSSSATKKSATKKASVARSPARKAKDDESSQDEKPKYTLFDPSAAKKTSAASKTVARPPARKAKDDESQDEKPNYTLFDPLAANKTSAAAKTVARPPARKAKDDESQDEKPKYTLFDPLAAKKTSAASKTVARPPPRKAKDDESSQDEKPKYTLFDPSAAKKTSAASKTVARPPARKAKDDESQVEKPKYTLFDPLAAKKTPSTGNVSTPLRSASSRGSSPKELFQSPKPESSEKQPKEYDSDDDDESYDPDVDQNLDEHLFNIHDDTEQQPRSPAKKRSHTISYLGAMVVLLCALGWCFDIFGTLPTKTRITRFPCFETSQPDVEDDNRESWTDLICRDARIPLLPCPVGGRCVGGQLVGCANDLLVLDTRRCSVTSEGNATVANYVAQLSKSTVDHKCYYSKQAAGESECKMPLFSLEQVALDEDPIHARQLMETYNALHGPPTFDIVTKSLQILVGLNATVPMSMPKSCIAKNIVVYLGKMFWFWLGTVLGRVAEWVRGALLFVAEVWWGCLRELPKTTIGTTLFTIVFTTLWTKTTRKRRANKQLRADVEKAEADVLRTLQDAPSSEHESNLLLETLKARVRGVTMKKRFVQSVWPHVTRRMESNPNLIIRERLKNTSKGQQVVVVWQWNPQE
jgi:hypothetical protein